VSKWFDRGQLKGYRIPGSGDRRIPRAELLRFMKVHNIPTTALEAANIRVLIIDSDMEMAHAIVKALQSKADYQVETAENSFDAGVAAHKLNPHVILLNLLAEGIDATSLYKYIRGNDQLQSTKVVAVADPLSSTEVAALLKKGFDGFVPRNAEILQIVKAIEQATAIVY
jgi:DNA-binding NarL/FixJ family response regulator